MAGKRFEDCRFDKSGRTLGMALQTEHGRNDLKELVKRPIKDDSFAGWTQKRNAWINEKLQEMEANVSGVSDIVKMTTSPYAIKPSVPVEGDQHLEQLKNIVFHLSEISSLLETLLKKDQIEKQLSRPSKDEKWEEE